MKKMLMLAMCLMAAMVLLTGCGGNELAGTWKLVDAQGIGMGGYEGEMIQMASSFGGTVALTFTDKEMTMSVEMFGVSESQTDGYAVKGNTIALDSGNEMAFEIREDTLTLSQDGSSLTLTRMKR